MVNVLAGFYNSFIIVLSLLISTNDDDSDANLDQYEAVSDTKLI